MVVLLCPVYNLGGFLGNVDLFGVHFVLGEVFHINRAEVAQPYMKGDFGEINSLYLHTLEQLLAEVQACSRSSYCSLMLGVNSLIAFPVFGDNLPSYKLG